ncbi:MAG: dockerin type I repeat-containing protein, partial [Dethiobacteria bacterium]
MISCVPKYNKTVISILLISFLISIIAVPVYGQAEVGFMYGDVNENGKIDVGDTILILRHIVDLIDLAEIEGYALFAADVSANNEIDVFDAIYLLRRITGLSAEGDFPAEIRLADAEAIVTLAEESRASDLDVVRRAIEILLPDIPPRAELNARLDALEGLIAAIDAANAAIDALPDPADLTEDDIDAIKAARDLVNAAQELGAIDEDFTDPDKLEAAEAYIAALEAVVAAEESQLRADMDAAWELVNALPEGNSKDELKARLEAIEVLSAYGFEFNEPEKVVAGEEAVVPVTFKAVEEEDLGYDKVRFSFEVTARPGEDAEVTFKATDSLGTEHTF